MADLATTQPDRVIVAGDLVNRGPANRAVVETIAATEWDVIMGNHDKLVVSWSRGAVPDHWYDDPWWAPVGWVADQVDEWIAYLAGLPFDLRIDVDGADSIRIVHGSPRHLREGLHHFLDDATLAEILADVEEPIVVGAHTHIPMDREVDGLRIVNTGAVGLPFNHDPRAQYVLLTLRDDGTWNVEFRAVDYDRDAALEAFEISGFLEEGLAAWLFQREVETARNHLFPFERWASAQGLPLTWETWYAYLERAVSADSFFSRYTNECRPQPAPAR